MRLQRAVGQNVENQRKPPTGIIFFVKARRVTWQIRRAFFFYLYYAFARWLPVGNEPFGWSGRRLRALCGRELFYRCGTSVLIERKAWFRSGYGVSIGDRSNIGINANINGQVEIGEDVLMGPDVIIMSRNHVFADLSQPIRLQGYTEHRPVVIGNNVWIGARVIILPGVKIGSGAVIGAGSVVTKNIPEFVVAAGVPAKVIRHRT